MIIEKTDKGVWETMDLKKMQSFLVLAEIRNYQQAAESLYLAQSSLSQQISSMEKELGFRLIERDRRPLELTAEGEVFRRYAAQTLTAYDNMLDEAGGLSGKTIVPIGYFYTKQEERWTGKVRRFNAANEQTELVFRFLYGEEKLEALRKGSLNIGLCLRSPELEEAGFHFHHVFYDEMVFGVPYSNPLSDSKSLTPEDLRQEKIVIIEGRRTRAASPFFRQLDLSPGNYLIKPNMEDIFLACQTGNLICCMPSVLLPSNLKAVPLEGNAERLDYGWHYREQTPEVEWILENLT